MVEANIIDIKKRGELCASNHAFARSRGLGCMRPLSRPLAVTLVTARFAIAGSFS